MGKKYKNTIPQRRNAGGQNILKDAQSHELAEKNKLEVTGKKEIQLLPSAMYEGSFLPEEPSGCAHKNSPRVGLLTLLEFILILLCLIQSRVFYTFIFSSICSASVCRSSLSRMGARYI